MEYFDTNKIKVMGKRIQTIRKNRRMTQVQLAENLGISKDQMSNIENGKSACKPDYIFQLVQILGISSDYLFFGKAVSQKEESKNEKIMVLLSEAAEKDREEIYQIISVAICNHN